MPKNMDTSSSSSQSSSNIQNSSPPKSDSIKQDKRQELNRNNVLSSQPSSSSSSNVSSTSALSASNKKLNKLINLNVDNQANCSSSCDSSIANSSSTHNNSQYTKKNFLEQLKLEKRYNVKKLPLTNIHSDSENLCQLAGYSKLTLENSLLRENKDIYSTKLNLNETSDEFELPNSNSNTQSNSYQLDGEERVKYDNNSDDLGDVQPNTEPSFSSSRLDQEDLSSNVNINIINNKVNSQPINHRQISPQPSSDVDLNIYESNVSQSNCNINQTIRNTHSMSSRNIHQMNRSATPNVDTNNIGLTPCNRLTQSVSLNPSSSSQCCHNHFCHHSHFASQRMEMNSIVPITSFRQQQLANQKNIFDLGMSSIQASTIISNHCNTDHSTNPSNLTAVTKLTSSSSGLPVTTLTVMESPNLSSSRNAGYNWQAFMPTLKNRMATIFNCELLADIHFIVGKGNAQTRFPAHKFVLSIGSAVFDAMFNGLLTKTNYCNSENINGLINNKEMEIELPDIEPDAFKALLRFLYLDEVQIDPETVMTTLYAAKKYEVPALEIACVDFLKANLNPDNAFMLLTQALLFDEAPLADLCLETIDKHTMDAIYSDSFLEIDLDTLKLVLSRDSLRVREVSLFMAVLQWAEMECSRNMTEVNSENKRKALGDALYLFRFPLMSIEEFAANVAQSGLLTDKEIVNLFLYFTVSTKPSVPFSIEPRCSITGHESTVNRFQRTESRWGYSGTSDRIRFLTDRPIFLIGFGLFGSIHGPSEYEVMIEIIHTGSGKVMSSNSTSFLSDGSDSIFRVMFKYPVEIAQNTNYTACATLKGMDSYYGTNGCRTVTVNLGKGVTKDNVTFQFSYAAGCNNGTSVEDGQIPEIIFYT